MNNTDQLRQLMTLDADINTPEIELRFEQIAKMLFESFAIQKGETMYLFKEIEFYFYNKNHRDIITHPRESKPLCWYINDFGGIDLNFGSKIRYEKRLNSNGKKVEKCVLDDSAYFGGILIRQLISEDGCEILSGPLACAELFRCHNATGVDKEFPVLVDNNAIVKYIRKPRVNLLRSKQSVEDKVNNILYQYHDNIQSFKETLYQDFINFKDKPYGYEQQIASR
ncbi:MAG: hypothetical protein PUC16_01090 [Bacteroidales bacterium]|nr:hypothetical protein [Bacteroidales bacterium]MDD5960855.1 hypothetical protein [Bacteroidales bacterium]MDY5922195.1 hypothetical protein [Candidatus Onthomorpha sp.]